ncbi:MAG: cytidine deaminase [Patescibacteria group bacterium]|jgi:cytidine deaminase
MDRGKSCSNISESQIIIEFNHTAEMNFDILYKKALDVSLPRDLTPGYSSCGGVGSALITKGGNIYTGICVDCSSGIGFCAEHAAIAEMLKNKESEITEIIAVRENGNVVSPCGRCRELVMQIDVKNRDTIVHLSGNQIKKMNELLPDYWITAA